MITLLLLLSILMNIAVIFAIIILYLRQNRFLIVEKRNEKLLGEMEELLSAYMMELKEDHEKFIGKLKSTEISHSTFASSESTADMKNVSHSQEELQPIKSNEDNRLSKIPQGVFYSAAKKAYQPSPQSFVNDEEDSTFSPPTIDFPEESVEKSPLKETLKGQILRLRKQGYTTEDIARSLNKGKTEIELILKFDLNSKE